MVKRFHYAAAAAGVATALHLNSSKSEGNKIEPQDAVGGIITLEEKVGGSFLHRVKVAKNDVVKFLDDELDHEKKHNQAGDALSRVEDDFFDVGEDSRSPEGPIHVFLQKYAKLEKKYDSVNFNRNDEEYWATIEDLTKKAENLIASLSNAFLIILLVRLQRRDKIAKDQKFLPTLLDFFGSDESREFDFDLALSLEHHEEIDKLKDVNPKDVKLMFSVGEAWKKKYGFDEDQKKIMESGKLETSSAWAKYDGRTGEVFSCWLLANERQAFPLRSLPLKKSHITLLA